MRLILDTSAVAFQVTRAAEARKDFGKDVQKVDRKTGLPEWVVEVLAQDNESGEVIRVTVTGDQPKATPGSQVRFDALEAFPWNNAGKAGVAYRAAAIHAAIAVASYLAKYATKSTEAVGTIACRITADNLPFYGNTRSHRGRLIRAAWHLGSHTAPDFRALRRWAHMLGYRGHFATKSRRYSTALRALRQARADYRRRQRPLPDTGHDGQAAVITVTSLEWDGMGWRTTGDALLALSAAARARDHDQAPRDHAQAA